jgi:hypothetical protein
MRARSGDMRLRVVASHGGQVNGDEERKLGKKRRGVSGCNGESLCV